MNPFPASTGRLDRLAIRARYLGVRGKIASKNTVVRETEVRVAGYSQRPTHLNLHLAAGDNFREKAPANNATRRRYSLIDASL